MIRRSLGPQLEAALGDSPVVLLHGARQTGKTTLARALGGGRYVTLDDATSLAAAIADPRGFVEQMEGRTVIDEVQRAPGLFPAIKMAVDRERTPGRFLLTGSANVLLRPRLSESLAGRMEVLTLLPLSQGEIGGVVETFVDAAFAGGRAMGSLAGIKAADVLERALVGGYPEVVGRKDASRRAAWFGSYLTTILQRDVRDLANVEGLTALPRLLTMLAGRAGGLLNTSDLSRGLGLPLTTLRRYLSLLEATFLVMRAPAWPTNVGLRVVKAPKVYLADTGLLSHLLGLTAERIAAEPMLAGPLLENFVYMELVKQARWSAARPRVLHFRTVAGREVDFVLENRAGEVVGVEVKASASVSAGDFRGLRALAEAAGPRMRCGVVLYAGTEIVPFGEGMWAAPVGSLWAGASTRAGPA